MIISAPSIERPPAVGSRGTARSLRRPGLSLTCADVCDVKNECVLDPGGKLEKEQLEQMKLEKNN